MENPAENKKINKTAQDKLDKVKKRYEEKKTEIVRGINLTNILKFGRCPSKKTMEKYDISYETVCLILEQSIKNLKNSRLAQEEKIVEA